MKLVPYFGNSWRCIARIILSSLTKIYAQYPTSFQNVVKTNPLPALMVWTRGIFPAQLMGMLSSGHLSSAKHRVLASISIYHRRASLNWTPSSDHGSKHYNVRFQIGQYPNVKQRTTTRQINDGQVRIFTPVFTSTLWPNGTTNASYLHELRYCYMTVFIFICTLLTAVIRIL